MGVAKVVDVSLNSVFVDEVSGAVSLEPPPQDVRDMRLMMAMKERRMHEKYTSHSQ